MPQLLLFAPCDRVILGQGDNSLSLISVLQNVQINVQSVPPEANAVIAGRWSVVALWQKEPSDGDAQFEQGLVLRDPDGQARFDQITPFRMEKTSHRLICEMPGFPVHPDGVYQIELSFHQKDDGDWSKPWVFPLNITLVPHHMGQETNR